MFGYLFEMRLYVVTQTMSKVAEIVSDTRWICKGDRPLYAAEQLFVIANPRRKQPNCIELQRTNFYIYASDTLCVLSMYSTFSVRLL